MGPRGCVVLVQLDDDHGQGAIVGARMIERPSS